MRGDAECVAVVLPSILIFRNSNETNKGNERQFENQTLFTPCLLLFLIPSSQMIPIPSSKMSEPRECEANADCR